ncbi:MAG: gamma-glutamyl-gamma-aminobutyrate hydrolase family protein [Chitinophagaceae bacterium]
MKIGLTLTEYEHKHHNYVNWLKGANDNNSIEVIVFSTEKNNVDELNDCDGLVLSGGIDSNPKYYNGKEDYPDKPSGGWNDARDEMEFSLYRSALKKGIPVLAICRGLQLVNIFHGGTLIQDLGELNKSHRAEKENDKRHVVSVFKDTLLHEITGEDRGEVNSAHHQSINQTANDLMINCRAEDGTMEGAEWKDKGGKPFLLCVQWHPERMYKFNLQESSLSKKIRDRFIEEIKKSIENKK